MYSEIKNVSNSRVRLKLSVVFKSFLVSFCLICGVHIVTGQNVEYLQRMSNVPEHPQTISGFSSGGTMASQMQIAFSKHFDGAALFGSIWYRCAPYGEVFYRVICSKGFYSVQNGIEAARNYEREGKIDPLENLNEQLFYHYIGRKDELISPAVREKTRTFYEQVGMDPANIKIVFQDSVHCMPTANSSDPSCRSSQIFSAIVRPTAGVAYCDYYGAFEGMNYLFRNTLYRPQGHVTLEPLRYFNQSVFLAPQDQHFMDPIGFLYVPSKCKSGTLSCPLHVAMHGCEGSRSRVGTTFIERSGYLEVAEVNSIILLIPQSIRFRGNKFGCWDIAGYSNKNYANKYGVQTQALGRMIGTITGAVFN